jgi:hypothetical protein
VVLRQLGGAKTRLNLMILDACRNNPFGSRGFRAATGGLAQMQAPEGTLIVYATQPGNLAMDGVDGNSPFTKVLAATIKRPGLDVFSMFNEVGLQVKRLTGGAQQPWVSSSPVDGEFYFAGLPPAPATVAPPPAVAARPDAEALFWQSISASSNPELYQAYLRQYPNGKFASQARARVEQLTVTPAPTRPTAAIFDETVVRSVAREMSVPLPERIPMTALASGVAPEDTRYFGAWRSAQPWVSRQEALLIVTGIAPSGGVTAILATSRNLRPPTKFATIYTLEGSIDVQGLKFSIEGSDFRESETEFVLEINSEGQLQGPKKNTRTGLIEMLYFERVE